MVITRQLTDSASASTASDIQLGSCVTEIGQGAFSGYTNITDVEFPDSLTTIGVGAFSGSSITSVEFPSSVTTIGVGAFSGCSNLTNITVNAVTPPTLGEGAFDGSTCAIIIPSASYDSYIQSSWSAYKNRITYEGMTLKLNFVNGSTSSFLICDGNSITKDDVDSIYFSDITATTVGSCVTEIGEYAFSGKTLGNVTFEEGTTTIGNEAFYDINTNLAYSTITLPKSLTTIGNRVFHSSADTRLEINAYGDSGLALTKKAFEAWDGHKGTYKLNLYNMSILANAFSFTDYGLREVCVYGVSNIGSDAFRKAQVTAATIGDGVKIIESGAFQGNSGMTSLTFGNSLLDIGASAFRSCSGLTSVVIPDSVISIGSYAFSECNRLKNLTISNNISSIEEGTFKNCGSISSITIGNNTTSVETSAFENCNSISSITIGNNVATIGDYAFRRDYTTYSDKMERIVNMPDSVINVGDYAFDAGDGTTYFNKLSSNIANIGIDAFQNCRFENFVLPRTIRTIGDSAFEFCSGLTSVTIPSGVTSIGDSAFKGCDITSIIFENGITSIGNYAFSGCRSLTSITIPNSVTIIDDSAFEGCSSLTSITIPNSVTSIGNGAFYYCRSLTSVTVNATTPPTLGSDIFGGYTPISRGTGVILVPCECVDAYKAASGWSDYASCILGLDPCAFIGKIKAKDANNNVIIMETCSSTDIGNGKYKNNLSIKEVEIGSCTTSIGNYAFSGCSNLSSIDFMTPSSISSIGGYAFSGCTSLTSITIPNSVTSIGNYAFSGCRSLTSITIPNSVTIIDDSAFEGCRSLTSITIPNSVTSIGNGAFRECSSLITVSLPNGLTSITPALFRECLRLLSITIPSGVTSIGDSAFYGCRSLTGVTVNATTPPTLGATVFDDTSDCPIYVPATSVDAYKEAVPEGWSSYASRIQPIPNP